MRLHSVAMNPLCWNDPEKTWKLASYQPPTERRAGDDRRDSERRAAVGDRRRGTHRALTSLRRL